MRRILRRVRVPSLVGASAGIGRILLILVSFGCGTVHSYATKVVFTMTPDICDRGNVSFNSDVSVVLGDPSKSTDHSNLVLEVPVVAGWPSSSNVSSSISSSNSDQMPDLGGCASCSNRSHYSIGCAPQLGIFRAKSGDKVVGSDHYKQPAQSTNYAHATPVPAALVSRGSLTDLLNVDSFSNDTRLSFELWIKPQTSGILGETIPILTIGTKYPNIRPESTPGNDEGECKVEQKDFQLAIVNSTWIVAFKGSPSYFSNCHRRRFGPPVAWSNLTHVLITMQNQRQVAYINGQEYVFASEKLSPMLDWDGRNSGLYVLGYHDLATKTTVSATTLYQVTLYHENDDTTASLTSDVPQLLRQNLPSTRPFAYDQVLIVNEDAEQNPGSHPLGWYRIPPSITDGSSPSDSTNSLAWLAGPLVASLDHEVLELVQSLPSSTSERMHVVAPVHVFATSLPSVGHLYFSDGKPLLQFATTPLAARGHQSNSSSLLIPLGMAPVSNLIYIPPFNVNSVNSSSSNVLNIDDEATAMTSFQYCVSDHSTIFHASQCLSTATAYIQVLAVNDPPVAHAPQALIVVREGLEVNLYNDFEDLSPWPKISLLGSDVDTGDVIQNVQITKPPIHGDLILAVSSFRNDFLPHGTLLSDENFTVRCDGENGEDGVYVKHIWKQRVADRRLESNDNASALSFAPSVIHGKNVMDSFSFRVQDSQGAWSLEERVDLLIASAVTGHTQDPSLVLHEDWTGSIHWQGNDTSGYNRNLRFYVEAIPPPHVGVLKDLTSKKIIKAGDVLEAVSVFPYETAVSIQFQGTPNYCHDQISNNEYDAEIRFRVAALENGAVASVSEAVSQTIVVACTFDTLSMNVPVDVVSVLETSLGRAMADHSNTNEDSPHNLMIHGIEVTSADGRPHRNNLARVSVSTSRGYLSFNAEYWNRTEPVQGRRAWASGQVVFLAYPDDLSNILAGLRYQSYHAGNDTIHFEVRYGNTCSPDTAAATATAHGVDVIGTCQVMERSIGVEIQRDKDKYKPQTRLVASFPWQILFCLLVYPILYAAVIFVEATLAGDHDDTETVVAGSPMEPVERFVQHEDEHGMFYYEDTLDGSVRWDLPTGEDFVRYEDIEQ